MSNFGFLIEENENEIDSVMRELEEMLEYNYSIKQMI
jgi:hypothetical protein